MSFLPLDLPYSLAIQRHSPSRSSTAATTSQRVHASAAQGKEGVRPRLGFGSISGSQRGEGGVRRRQSTVALQAPSAATGRRRQLPANTYFVTGPRCLRCRACSGATDLRVAQSARYSGRSGTARRYNRLSWTPHGEATVNKACDRMRV
jgi:hypothetical protein